MKYKVTSKVTRPLPLQGSRKSKVENTEVTEWFAVMANPGGTIDTDLDLSPWVELEYIEPVAVEKPLPKPEPKPEPKPSPLPKEPEPEPEPEPESPVSESEPPEDGDYEELDDGGYRCLHCGKEYKPGPRALEYIENHVAEKH